LKKEVTFYKVHDPYGWMSNLAPYAITKDELEWPTVENLLLGLRFADQDIQESIRQETSPMDAKHRAALAIKSLTKEGRLDLYFTPPCSEQDVFNLEMALRLKVQQHPFLLQRLLYTAGHDIYFDVSPYGAKDHNLFWGAKKLPDGNWEGENVLGKLWVKIREEAIEPYRTFTSKERNFKFGLGDDPYKELKEAYDNGYDIAELHVETMQWSIPLEINWSKPVKCYRIERR